jgi:FKBP-type peptidyl-prolyl cis-trans isomerase
MLPSLLVVLASTEQPCVESGSHVSIRYTGSIHSLSAAGTPGNVYDEGTISFVVGRGEVILGMDEGVVGACVGDTRTLVVPPEKGYGEAGLKSHERGGKWWEGIPGDATLQLVVCVRLKLTPTTAVLCAPA